MSIVNINVGVLGHVDSGKTSLVKALSTTLSTASLDKSPQSQERGMTQDLGFSAFFMPMPEHLAAEAKDTQIQFTLVDCPGHATLIKTIIGGAQIIDQMILVIDATKGIQTQTAECIVIGEILSEASKLTIVLNKCDQLTKKTQLPKLEKKLRKVFANTVFGKDVSMVAVSANPGGSAQNLTKAKAENAAETAVVVSKPQGMDKLVAHLLKNLSLPSRVTGNDKFVFSLDHCFRIGGQGTVLTGTVLSGDVKVGDMIEFPTLGITKKVKSMQMFKQAVQVAHQGDRVGLCVTQLDPKLLERGIACTPGSVSSMTHMVVSLSQVRFYKQTVKTNSKFHITIGHTTALATLRLIGDQHVETTAAAAAAEEGKEQKRAPFSLDHTYKYLEALEGGGKAQYAILSFAKPIYCQPDAIIIGSRLDTEISGCRIAFHGQILQPIAFDTAEEKSLLKLFKYKHRSGKIDRVVDEQTIIVKELFAKEADLKPYFNMKLTLDPAKPDKKSSSSSSSSTPPVTGVLVSGFGKGSKCKVQFRDGHGITGNGKLRKVTLTLKQFTYRLNKRELVQ